MNLFFALNAFGHWICTRFRGLFCYHSKILYFPCFILWVISFITQCTKMKAFSLEARLSQVFLYFVDFVWIIWSEARAILCCTKMFSIKGCFDDRNLPIQVRLKIVISCLLYCRLGMQINAIERFQPVGLNSSLPSKVFWCINIFREKSSSV